MPPKCPYCNEELEYEERMDAQNYGDCYVERWAGYCPRCIKTFRWSEVYNYSGSEELEEEKELE